MQEMSMVLMCTVFLTKRKIVEAIGEIKGLDVSQMTGVEFAEFKETQYDILASELRKHLDMKKIYEILEAGI